MKWCYLFLVIRLTIAELTNPANIAFVPQTPIALPDSIELIEIAVPFPKPLDIDWGLFKIFFENPQRGGNSHVERDAVGILQ